MVEAVKFNKLISIVDVDGTEVVAYDEFLDEENSVY